MESKIDEVEAAVKQAVREEEKNKLRDKENKLRDEKNKLRDEKNKLRDEKNQLRDKESKLRQNKQDKAQGELAGLFLRDRLFFFCQCI
jgi:hypothetical protein